MTPTSAWRVVGRRLRAAKGRHGRVNCRGQLPPVAGRNSIRGPAQFALNAGVGRTFLWGDRLNLDWRVDATNVLNRVTYAGVNTILGSPQFGLPNVANPMRKLQTTLRLRF